MTHRTLNRLIPWLSDRLRVARRRVAERPGRRAARELARVQLTEADLARLSAHATPLADWPDEDVDAMFGPPSGRSDGPA